MQEPITISELTREIKILLENDFKFVYITGEISNYKFHTPSGHSYFLLKDDKASINAVMWSSRYSSLKFKPKDGTKVIVKGRITLYETRGTYQVDVFDMTEYGIGDLHQKFELLKKKLSDEGLFDSTKKRLLPEFPQRVAVITSETGAAIEDFKNITLKRYPVVKLFLFSTLVQGAGSKESVCRAIELANNSKYNIDIIVITRGGGSMEDLWTFNEESVVRALANSRVPTVSAIGHDIDFTLCDFVADLRTPTPTAAAEAIFPDKNELLERIKQIDYYIKISLKNKIRSYKESLKNMANSYVFKRPLDTLNEYKMNTDEYQQTLEKLIKEKLYTLNNSLNIINKLLFNMSPEQTLKRGFTYIIKDGRLIPRKEKIKQGENIKIKFYDGEIDSQVK